MRVRHALGLLLLLSLALASLPGCQALPGASAARDWPLRPALRIATNGKPSRGTRRDSIPAAVPTKVTTASGRRRTISRATATPG